MVEAQFLAALSVGNAGPNLSERATPQLVESKYGN
jgi:hypothetical protein